MPSYKAALKEIHTRSDPYGLKACKALLEGQELSPEEEQAAVDAVIQKHGLYEEQARDIVRIVVKALG